MRESRKLVRLPVFDISTGRLVGRIRKLVVDPAARKVVGFVLNPASIWGDSRFLAFADLHALGDDAATVRGAASLVSLGERRDLHALLRGRSRLYHTPVLTEGGRFVGEVEEFAVDPGTGLIEAFRVSGGLWRDLARGPLTLAAERVVAIGEDAVIVSNEALDRRPEETGEPGRQPATPAPGMSGLTRRLTGFLTTRRSAGAKGGGQPPARQAPAPGRSGPGPAGNDPARNKGIGSLRADPPAPQRPPPPASPG